MLLQYHTPETIATDKPPHPTAKPAQQPATSQCVRRGRCLHRPGRRQSQNCTHHRRIAQRPYGCVRVRIGASRFGGAVCTRASPFGGGVRAQRRTERVSNVPTDLSVAFGDSSPKGRAKELLQTCRCGVHRQSHKSIRCKRSYPTKNNTADAGKVLKCGKRCVVIIMLHKLHNKKPCSENALLSFGKNALSILAFSEYGESQKFV